MSETYPAETCTMKEPNIHPACVAAERQFIPAKWNVEKRVMICKPCASLRNAAYRVKRAGGTEAAQEAARERARQGLLNAPVARPKPEGSPEAPTSARSATRAASGPAPRQATSVGDGHFYLLNGSNVEKMGGEKYIVTPATIQKMMDFTREEPAREGATIIDACPNCGKRGETRRPKQGWIEAFITHKAVIVGRMPRTVEYCTISHNHSISDAMREVSRSLREAGKQQEAEAE